MRHYLKKLIIVFLSLYLAYSLIPTISLGSDPKNLLIIIMSFFGVSVVIKPFFTLVLLPFNIFTTILVSYALNFAVIYALKTFLAGAAIEAYHFPGANLGGVILEPVSLNVVVTIAVIALIVTVTQKVLHIIFN